MGKETNMQRLQSAFNLDFLLLVEKTCMDRADKKFERNLLIFKMYLEGKTFGEIAKDEQVDLVEEMVKKTVDRFIFKITRHGDTINKWIKVLGDTPYFWMEPEEILVLLQKAKEIPKSEGQMEDLLATPITELDISVNQFNAFRTAKIETLGELIEYSLPEVLKLDGIGEKGAEELEELVAGKGLSFRQP